MFGIEKKHQNTIRAYRSDIDGLRAIAVISVMLYHFSIGHFSGGFVGVDIFFVISGYLITGGIIKQGEAGKFSFSDFYIRRARRLFPALLVTIILSYVAAFWLFSPIDFANMSGSTIFALGGISNIFFWMEADYFDSASILKPLLHTWSLSVELQFYLIWPAILLLLIKFGRKITGYGVVAVTIAGLISSIFALKYDPTGAFYLTQYRFYEFAVGGLAFLVGRSKFMRSKYYMPNMIFVVGIALVFYSIFSYSTETAFPGLNALPPVIGAALIILSGEQAIGAKILSLRPVSYIGEISYSLYLIHWPLVVFVQYFSVKEISSIERYGLVAATFVLSVSMHRLIEKPFRNPKVFDISGTAFALACSCIAIVVMIPASSSWANKGWVWRLPEQIQKINDFDVKSAEKFLWNKHVELAVVSDFKNNGKEKLLIAGDSQSADLVNILNESGIIDNYDVVVRLIYTQCGTPFVNKDERDAFFNKKNLGTIGRADLIPICGKQMDALMDSKILGQADKIFIAMKWYNHSLPKLGEAVSKISSMSNAPIYLFGNKILAKGSIDFVNSLGRVNGISEYASEFRDERSDAVNQKLSEVTGVNFVDMMKLTCPSPNSCNVLTDDLKPIFFDAAHLTKEGAAYLGKSFPSILPVSPKGNLTIIK
ncbi:acyltransferase family protein [Yersinia sp. 2105 StPb PI]|uniref:acyltransferase family protein n=1 Tax=Yersinia sp. 2105 StPb PI TaxID=2507058 RepID=UPI00067B7C8F|nr:acyltransferase family protein [Yersinia sp. 2105 StPb PI]